MSKKNGKKSLITEFKEFITKGNVLDMAVGVIIGNAFKAIVTAMTDNIIMPVVTKVVGKNSLTDIKTVLTEAVTETVVGENGEQIVNVITPELAIGWGLLLQAVVDFFIIALVLFVIVKVAVTFQQKRVELMEKLKKKEEEAVVEEPAAPAAPSIEEQNKELLAEIRDLLKEKNGR